MNWIRSMTDEELARHVINPCGNHECGECPLRDGMGRCVLNPSHRDGNGIAAEWLGSECQERML